jgi:hypothetical protein
MLVASVEADLEGVLSGPRQGEVKDQDRPRLHVGDPRRWFPELNGSFPFHQSRPLFVDEPDAHRVVPDFRASAAHPEYEMRARMDGRECGNPDVLKQTQHGEFALLVDQGIVGEHGEVQEQLTPPGSR